MPLPDHTTLSTVSSLASLFFLVTVTAWPSRSASVERTPQFPFLSLVYVIGIRFSEVSGYCLRLTLSTNIPRGLTSLPTLGRLDGSRGSSRDELGLAAYLMRTGHPRRATCSERRAEASARRTGKRDGSGRGCLPSNRRRGTVPRPPRLRRRKRRRAGGRRGPATRRTPRRRGWRGRTDPRWPSWRGCRARWSR